VLLHRWLRIGPYYSEKVVKLLICPGLPRCGTTYLFHQLANTGASVFNIPYTKETNYFSRTSQCDEKSFRSLYSHHSDDKIYLDFSPAYLADPRAILRIADFSQNHNVRVIVSLRHPVDQAFAHYLHDLKAHVSKRERTDPYYPFFCAASLKRYLVKRASVVRTLVDAVGRENVFTVNFHTDLTDVRILHSRLSDFLNMDTHQFSLAPERISPGGWLPYYVYGGAEGSDIAIGDAVRTVPANHLLLVNGPDSFVWQEVPDAIANNLIRGATTWTRRIEAVQAHEIYNAVSDDFLELLGIFGLDRDMFGPTGELVAATPNVAGAIIRKLPIRAKLIDRITQFSTEPERIEVQHTIRDSTKSKQTSDTSGLEGLYKIALMPQLRAARSRSQENILFVQTADPKKYRTLLEISSRTVEKYCSRNNYRYYSHIGVIRGSLPWHATFNRIPILYRLAQGGFSGWVCYLDADAFVADLNFDLSKYLTDKSDIALIAAPGGQPIWWDVNAGVLFFNFAHPLGHAIVREWHTAFGAITDHQLQAMIKWSLPNDQSLLHEALRTVQNVENHIVIDRAAPPLINYGGRFIKQILRVAGSLEEREGRLCAEVSRVLGNA
jgi:hypothetical protein